MVHIGGLATVSVASKRIAASDATEKFPQHRTYDLAKF